MRRLARALKEQNDAVSGRDRAARWCAGPIASAVRRATPFHNDVDGDGCLMDRGGDLPLGERAQQPGFARTSFCYDEVDYLAEIVAP